MLCLIPLILTGDTLVDPSFALIFTFLIPLCTAFAILGYRLMGIDDLLHGTLIYMATMGLLIGIDLSLMGILGARFGGQLDLRQTGKGDARICDHDLPLCGAKGEGALLPEETLRQGTD